MLGASEGPLVAAHDLVMLDLDGVVYIGSEPVPGAPDHLDRARAAGAHLAFVTNNASRTPESVAKKLTRMGVTASGADVVTSAQAAARMLGERLPPGARVACLGAAGLQQALRASGLEPVDVGDDGAVALATGYNPDVPWRDVMRAATLLRGGLPWVASNRDLSLPTPFGTAPGHGVMVRMLEEFGGVTAEVAGKPERPLLDETVRRVGGERPLMVGDRLDTDIEGANRAELPSLLVRTGVTDLAELVAAPPALRPTYLSADLSGLFTVHRAPEREGDAWVAGGWRAGVEDGALVVTGNGSADDWWRATVSAAWTHLDTAEEPAGLDGVAPPPGEADGNLET